MPYRVILVAPRTPRVHSAGIENYVLHLARFLKGKNLDVEIWGTERKTQCGEMDGIPYKEFKGYSPGQAYYFSLDLFSALQNENAPIVHANGFNNMTTIFAMMAKKKNQKLVVTMNSSAPSSILRKVLRYPFVFIFKKLSNRLDKIICVSKNELSIFKEMLPVPKEKFVLIPNGVEREEFEKISVPKKKGQLILIGRMVKTKGHARVLNALPIILQLKQGVVLHLVGTGPLEKDLRAHVKRLGLDDSVVFHGSIPFSEREKLLRLMKESQALILLSDYEGNALVFSEARAANIPMIVHDTGVMHEYVEEGMAAGISNVDNPEEVANLVVHVMENPQRYVKTEIPPMNWEEVGEKVLCVYEELIESSLKEKDYCIGGKSA